jgi:hypothetical protein
MYRRRRDIVEGKDDEHHLQPHILCIRCQDICGQSTLIHDVPEKYSVCNGRNDSDAEASRDDVQESYQHGTLAEIESSCLEGCFLCGFMYYSRLQGDCDQDSTTWEACLKSTDRVRFNVIAREYTRECRIEYKGVLSGTFRVFIDGGQ